MMDDQHDSEEAGDGRGDLDPRLAWPSERFVDETVEATEASVTPRDDRERAFIVQQRFVHGLLRAGTQDAESREHRVQRVLTKIARDGLERERAGRAVSDGQDASVASSGRVLQMPPAAVLGTALAAAGVLLAFGLAFSVWWSGREALPAVVALPPAEEVLEEVGDRLETVIDRRYSVEMRAEALARPDRAARITAELVTRPGRQFVLTFRHPRFQRQIGSDGEVLWWRRGPTIGGSVPLDRFEKGFGRTPEPVRRALDQLSTGITPFLDSGQLSVDDVLQRLRRDCSVRTTGRQEPSEPDGAPLIRIAATGLDPGPGKIERAVIRVDEETRMVHELAVTMLGKWGHGRARMKITYLGDEEPDASRYAPPN